MKNTTLSLKGFELTFILLKKTVKKGIKKFHPETLIVDTVGDAIEAWGRN